MKKDALEIGKPLATRVRNWPIGQKARPWVALGLTLLNWLSFVEDPFESFREDIKMRIAE